MQPWAGASFEWLVYYFALIFFQYVECLDSLYEPLNPLDSNCNTVTMTIGHSSWIFHEMNPPTTIGNFLKKSLSFLFKHCVIHLLNFEVSIEIMWLITCNLFPILALVSCLKYPLFRKLGLPTRPPSLDTASSLCGAGSSLVAAAGPPVERTGQKLGRFRNCFKSKSCS